MTEKVSLFSRFRAAYKVFRAAGIWKPQTITDLDNWMDSLAGGTSISGPYVSVETANSLPAFFSGVFQISQTIASCDLNPYKRKGENSKRLYSGAPLYYVLRGMANPYTNAFTWKEISQHHLIVWGNCYSYKQRDGGNRVIGLWQLNPERMRIEIEENGARTYIFRDLKYREHRYTMDEIFHIPGFGYDGIQGYPLITLHREAIGLGLSQQEFTSRFIRNGAHLSGVFSHPKTLSTTAHEHLKESIKEQYGGLSNAGRFMVVEEDMKFSPLTMPLVDAQFLESKVFSIQDIARILNISPYKLKDYSHATFSNVEHLGIEYVTETIRPWAERWEACIDTQLFSPTEQKKCFAEFNLRQLMRGDLTSMMTAFQTARNTGAVNADDIRQEVLDMNPIEDEEIGQVYLCASTMKPVEQILHPPEPPAPAPSGEPDEEQPEEEATEEEEVPEKKVEE